MFAATIGLFAGSVFMERLSLSVLELPVHWFRDLAGERDSPGWVLAVLYLPYDGS